VNQGSAHDAARAACCSVAVVAAVLIGGRVGLPVRHDAAIVRLALAPGSATG